MTLEEENQLIAGWRGRRFLACGAADLLVRIIAGLADDNGNDLPPDRGLPPRPSAMQIAEMQNTTTNLLRTILLWNDGYVSPSKINRF